MTWPHLEYETRPWAPTLDRGLSRRRVREYRSALVPRIAESTPSLGTATWALLDAATIAVAKFEGVHAHGVVPFAPLLLRSESMASSRIENLKSSARKVLEAELTAAGSPSARLIVANTRLMREAIEEDSPSTDAIRAMHRVLLREDAPEIAGELRTEPVWIGGREHSPPDALFVPPHQDQVKELLGDLEAFMARTDIPALAHAAVAHAQFETIHPFAGGNGRTGRALVHVMLKKHGLSRGTALPVSAGLLAQTTTYFTALDDYREGKVEPIVKLFAEAAVQAAEQGTWLSRQLQEIQREWKARLNARGDALAWDVLPLLLRRPVLTASAVAEELHTSSPNARNALDRLSKDGIVVAANLDKRTRAWRSPEVLEVLDEFAEAAGRRSDAPD